MYYKRVWQTACGWEARGLGLPVAGRAGCVLTRMG